VPRGEFLSTDRNDTASASRGRRLNYISFQFGHTTCAIDLRHVKEVMDAPEFLDSVLVHDCFIGIANLRGTIVPIADFRKFMGDGADFRARSPDPKRKVLIVETVGGPIGLLVYSINSIIACFQDEVLQFTKLALPRADIVKGCLLGKQDELVMLLDHDAINRDQILVDTAMRCREVYPPEDTPKSRRKEQVFSPRMTFIVFSFGNRFALDTARVSEVITYPDDLLRPPYALDFVDGIINLRGELITLINPRKLYGLPQAGTASARVLIFRHEDRKYGILVDSVDEIVITTAHKVAELTSMNHNKAALRATEDVCGCINSPTVGAVMILDVQAVLRRCFDRAGGAALQSRAAG
jgi:purine-binding chemotaxis protein CheW